MSRDQGETLGAFLHPARGCIPFPRKEILTPLLQSWKYRTRHQPMGRSPGSGKAAGSPWEISAQCRYLSTWCCDALAGSLTQCSELPQELQSPSLLQGGEGGRNGGNCKALSALHPLTVMLEASWDYG